MNNGLSKGEGTVDESGAAGPSLGKGEVLYSTMPSGWDAGIADQEERGPDGRSAGAAFCGGGKGGRKNGAAVRAPEKEFYPEGLRRKGGCGSTEAAGRPDRRFYDLLPM